MRESTVRLSDGREIKLGTLEGMPEAALADEARRLLADCAQPEAEARVLDLGCGAGLVGIVAAQRGAKAVAADGNLRYCRLAEANGEMNGVALTCAHSDGFDHLPPGMFSETHLAPLPHAPAVTGKKLIAESVAWLAHDGSLYLATHPRAGGKVYGRLAGDVFGGGEEVARVGQVTVWRYSRRDADVGYAERRAEELATVERDGFDAEVRGIALRFRTKAGVFSSKSIDRGTELLLQHMPEAQKGEVLDLGCGYGAIGIAAARLMPEASVTMADVDRRSLDLAPDNAGLNGCANIEVAASDGFSDLAATYDLVLSNLPAHVGKGALRDMLGEAREHLKPGGRLMAVINRELVVDGMAGAVFGNARTVAESATHRVFECEAR